MANVFKRFFKGILLVGESTSPSDNKEGSIFHIKQNTDPGSPSPDNGPRLKTYIESAVREIVTNSQTQALTNKTIEVSNNTIITAASGNLTSTNLNAALAELQTDVDSRVTTASNVGTGSGIFKQKSGSTLELKSLSAGPNITITEVGDSLQLTASGTIGVNDATTSSKGIVKLAGDLGGTADLPTVPALSSKAPSASPALTGTPTAPTAASGTNTTQIATTEFVMSNAFQPGDVMASYVQRTNFLECNGSYVYPESNYNISNILPLNSTSTQTINNPSPVTNGFFSPVVWLSSNSLLTTTRSSNPNPYYQKYLIGSYNTSTKTFGSFTDITSSWGFPTTAGAVYQYVNKIDNCLLFNESSSYISTTVPAYFKVVNLDINGNYVSTDTVDTGFTLSTVTAGSYTTVYTNMYKYNGGLYVYVQQLTGSTFTARKLFKKIGTSWTQIPLTISTPSGLSGYHLFYSHNSYVGLSYYNNSTSQYVTYIGKFLDENTISSFSLISESEGANYYIFSDTLDNIEFDGILMQTRSAYPNKSIISVKLQGSTYIKNSISFPEFPETYTPYSRNIASCFYNNTDLQLLRNFYGITNSNELLIFNSFDSSKKLLAFKLTINLDGSMNKQLIETHSYTYNVAFSLSTHRGYIEADGSFSSFSGRLFVVPSKVQLPTLTALASNLKYYIKVN